MGRHNVALVCTYWTDLPDRAFRVLVYVANLCRDGDPDARYYGGRDPLVHVLGTKPGEGAYRRVQRALADCVDAGALVVAKHGGNGRRAEYALALTRRMSPVDNPVAEDDETAVACHPLTPNSESRVSASDTLRVSADAGWVSVDAGCMTPSDTPKETPPTKPTTRDNSSLVTTSPVVVEPTCPDCGWLIWEKVHAPDCRMARGA